MRAFFVAMTAGQLINALWLRLGGTEASIYGECVYIAYKVNFSCFVVLLCLTVLVFWLHQKLKP